MMPPSDLTAQKAMTPLRRAQEELETLMKRILAALAAIFMSSGVAMADAPVSSADGEKVQAALKAWGCSGGKMEQETEATGIFEVNDAKCHAGQYDIKLDKDFKVISITRD
jgi:hypothetical protein